MSQKGYIHLYGNCLYSKVKFPVDRSSYNTCSTIFPIVFNLLIVILSSFCRWIQALCLRKPAVRNKDIGESTVRSSSGVRYGALDTYERPRAILYLLSV